MNWITFEAFIVYWHLLASIFLFDSTEHLAPQLFYKKWMAHTAFTMPSSTLCFLSLGSLHVIWGWLVWGLYYTTSMGLAGPTTHHHDYLRVTKRSIPYSRTGPTTLLRVVRRVSFSPLDVFFLFVFVWMRTSGLGPWTCFALQYLRVLWTLPLHFQQIFASWI